MARASNADASECLNALVEDLGWGLGVLFRAYIRSVEDAVAALPGGPRGYQVLSAAAQGHVNSQLALAQHLGIDRTVMTYLLDDLERDGLIERQPDPADRRARRIVATVRGADLLSRLEQRLAEAEARLLAPLDERDRDAFRSQVRLLAVQANAVDPVGSACQIVEETCNGAEGGVSVNTTPAAART